MTSASPKVDVRPELLRWACERAGDGGEALRETHPLLDEWVRGVTKPTLKQLESFAKAVDVPLGCLFLSAPPEEQAPAKVRGLTCPHCPGARLYVYRARRPCAGKVVRYRHCRLCGHRETSTETRGHVLKRRELVK